MVTLTLSCAAIATAYAAWAHRHPDSGLRYLVAPMVWFTVAMACLGLGRPIPQGEAVAIPGSAQLAATLAALVVTVAWARQRPRAALSEPSLVAAVPGLFILSLLTLLTWVAAQVPPALAVGAAGVLVVVGLELLSARLAGSVPRGDRAAVVVAGLPRARTGAGQARGSGSRGGRLRGCP